MYVGCVLDTVPQRGSSQWFLGDDRRPSGLPSVLDERRRDHGQHHVSRQRPLQDLLHGRRHQTSRPPADLDQGPLRQPHRHKHQLVILWCLEVVTAASRHQQPAELAVLNVLENTKNVYIHTYIKFLCNQIFKHRQSKNVDAQSEIRLQTFEIV